MLDDCVELEPGEEVLIVADINGLHGGDSLVDQEAISWIQSGVQATRRQRLGPVDRRETRGRCLADPQVATAAMAGCDVVINNAFFDLPTTELAGFRAFFKEKTSRCCAISRRTAPLLCSAWAQTPDRTGERDTLPGLPGVPERSIPVT